MKKVHTSPLAYLLAVLLLMGNIACSKTPGSFMQTRQGTAPITVDTIYEPQGYLALGDSYTIGQSVAAGDRFPAQTVDTLAKHGIVMPAPQYIATTGWTTIDLQNAINAQKPQGPYAMVTLLIGVNDQYQWLDTGGYRVRFGQLLQKSIQLAGNNLKRVFVLSIPDYSVTPFGGGSATIRQQIDEFNAINKQITDDAGVAYINITDISRLAATDPGLIAGDGLHPSAKQYTLWVQALVPVVQKAFGL